MADRIKGITIEIGGDTTKLQKALADSNKGIRTTQSALRDVNKLLKLDPGNATLLAQKQKELSKAVDSTRDKLQKLKTASEQAAATAKNYDAWKAAYDPIQKELLETQTKAQDLKKQMKELEGVGKVDTDAYKKLQSELDTTQQHAKELRAEAKRVSDEFGNPISPEQFDSLQREIIETEQDLKGLEKQFRDFGSVAGQKMQVVGDKVKAVGEKITAVGGTLTKYVTAPVAAVLTPATKAAIEYGDAIAKVATIADTSVVSVAELHDEILQLSNDTGKKAAELAEATYQAISGGVETANAVNFVAVSTNLAKAGFLETAGAVDVLTTIINAYGRSTEDAALISDQLVETQNKGKTTVQELAANIGTVIPTAAALNVPLDQLLTAYIGLTKNGVNTANATTFINSTLGELAKSGSDVSNILKEKTGKSFGQLLADGKTLCDVLEILGTQVNDDGEAFLNLWGNARAGRGALSLANAGAVEFADTLTGVQNATGNVSGALEALNTPGAKARKALNKISNAAIRMGDVVAPTLEKGADLLSNLADKWDKLSPKAKDSIVKAAAIAAAAGPVIAGLGKVTSGAGVLIGVAGKLIGFTGGSVIPTVAAVGVAIAGVVLVMKKDGVEAAKKLDDAVKSCTTAFENAEQTYQTATTSIQATADTGAILAQRLKELEDQSSMTAEEQAEYAAILDQLQVLFPNINLQIDDQTGCLVGGAEALERQISDWEQLAVVEAKQALLREELEAYVAAQVAQTEAQGALNAAQDEGAALQKHYNQLLGAYNSLEEERNRLNQNEKISNEEWLAQTERINTQQENIAGHLVDLSAKIRENKGEQDELTNALADSNDVLSECEKKYDSAKTAVENMTEAASQGVGKSRDIGADYADGIAEGVSEGAKNASDAASDLASDMVDTTREVLDEHSPSKVGADIGKNFDAGIALGVAQNSSQPVKALQKMMDTAIRETGEGIAKLKALMNFKWNFPKLALPHFSVTGSFSLNPPAVPKLSVDWYAKAMENGMILNHPTIFGAMGGKLLGGGERGAEAVIGVGSLRRIVRESVQQAESNRIVNNYFSFTISGDVKNGKQLYREFKRELQKDVDMRGATWA